jgi:hypothetical protein
VTEREVSSAGVLSPWGTGAALIVLPLIGMAFTQEVNWGPEDFGSAAALVLGVGVTYEIAVRTTRDGAYRAGVAVALAGAFVLLWANAAVGVIGSEDNPANLMFFAVPAVAILGALLARFRPHGMALAMAATAAAQVTVAAIALIAGLGFTGPITVFFTGLWLTSAWLFRKAAGRRFLAG